MSITIALILAATAIRPGGDMRDAAMRPPSGAPPLAIAAQPFARTVTCTGTRTLTGTATGAGAVTWSASPDGASGACTGTTSWSCPVAVSPNAAGEGVETITISQSGGGSATVDIGFYVAGAHSCFLAQSYDGAYNSGKADLAAVATWVNLGSSALNVTQATGSAQPTYRTSCAGDSPCIRFDGGDKVKAATAADWTFMNTGAPFSVMATARTTSADPNSIRVLMATAAVLGSTTSRGFTAYYDDRTASSINDKIGWTISSGAVLNINVLSANGDFSAAAWHVWEALENDDAGVGNDGFQWVDNAAVGAAAVSGAYSATAASSALTIGDEGTARTFAWAGDMGDILIYSSALTDTQRGINQAVADWEGGGSQINLASATWLFIGDSITAGSGGITTWVTKLLPSAPAGTVFTNRAASSSTAAQILAQWRAAGVPSRVFVLGGINDIAVGTTAVTTFASLSPIYSEASALGVDVVAMSTLPFGTAASWTAGRQTQLEALAVSVLGDVNIDHAIDMYTAMQDPSDLDAILPAYRLADGVHPSEAGTANMAAVLVASLGL